MSRRVKIFRPGPLGVEIPAGAEDALDVLLEAYDYAGKLHKDPWQFAVAIPDFRAVSVTISSLRWLLHKGYVEHAREKSRQPAGKRAFLRPRGLEIDEKMCFVLSRPGVVIARSLLEGQPIPPRASGSGSDANDNPNADVRVPHWDKERHELRWGSLVLKRFRVPAANQVTILDAFEEEKWPYRIDDPLSPVTGRDPRARLHSAINKLNLHHLIRFVRFRGDGTGLGVCWERVSNAAPERHQSGTRAALPPFAET
jgi:hypothetical protein